MENPSDAESIMLGRIIKGAVKQKVQTLRPAKPDDRPHAALIFGAGALPGIGAAVAQRVAAEGIPVYVTGRNQAKITATADAICENGGMAIPLIVDALQPDQIEAAFDRIEDDGHAVDLVLHNVGTNRHLGFLDITPELLEKTWRADCLSGFHIGQQAIAAMQPRRRGTIIFTGASASLRGKTGFATFASAKAGLRSIAQAMAREFGPQGIHVAHVVIDGVVDGDRIRRVAPHFIDQQGEDGALDPHAIAEAYWQLYQQHKTTWTHELDLRPYKESW